LAIQEAIIRQFKKGCGMIKFRLLILFAVLLFPSITHAAYDPTEGRWLSRDPLAEKVGPNLYQYVANNPLIYIDPKGLDGLDMALNPANAEAMLEASEAIDGMSPAMSDVITNAAGSENEGIQMAIKVSKDLGGDVDSKLDFIHNVLKKLGSKFGRKIVCREQDLGGGTKALILTRNAAGVTPVIIAAPNGMLPLTTMRALTADGTALTAPARAFLGLP
jgi:hypothetical protein